MSSLLLTLIIWRQSGKLRVMSTFSNFKTISVSVILLVASFSFIKTTLEIMKSSSRIDNLRAEVVVLEQNKEKLEKDLEEQRSREFIEKEAREKLNLIKPGEKIYVLDEEFENKLNNSLQMESGAALGDVAHNTSNVAGNVEGKKNYIKNLKMWQEIFY